MDGSFDIFSALKKEKKKKKLYFLGAEENIKNKGT